MAVGLDTPASAIELLDALHDDGMRVERDFARRRRADARADRRRRPRPRVPHRRAARGRAAAPAGRRLPRLVRDAARGRCARRSRSSWGPPPGDRYVDGDDFVIAGLELGNVRRRHPAAARLRRGPGRHLPRPRAAADPPLPRLLPLDRRRAGARDAIVHLGKHGTLEWLPGKMLAPQRVLRARRGARLAAARLPVRRQRPRRGRAGQAPRARRRSSTTSSRR